MLTGSGGQGLSGLRIAKWARSSWGFRSFGHKRPTAIIESYRRRESSVEKALIEMYLAGALGSRG